MIAGSKKAKLAGKKAAATRKLNKLIGGAKKSEPELIVESNLKRFHCTQCQMVNIRL